MNNIQYIKKSSIQLIPFLINLLIIMWIDTTSVFSFFYTIFLFLIINHFFIRQHKIRQYNWLILQLYILLAIILYLVQKYNIPDYWGMSGPNAIGTDDYRFMAMISDNSLLTELFSSEETHNYAYFLKILYPFPVHWPLNIVIPNLLGMVFLPCLTYQLANLLFNNEKLSQKAYFLTIGCPFLLFNGLILMRDNWVATFYMCGIVWFLNRKYLGFILASLLLFFLRSGSLVLLILAITIYSSYLLKSKFTENIAKRIYAFLLLGAIAGFIVIYQFLPLIFGSQFSESITRDDFVESFLSQYEDTLLHTISILPIYLRIPLVTLFFLFAPFLNLTVYTLGVFNLRMILFVIAFPLYFAYHSKAFFAAIIQMLHKPTGLLVNTVLLIIFSCTVLGLFSLQLRHKIPLMPLYYIVIACGYFQVEKPLYKISGVILAVLLLTIQIIQLII